MGFGLLLIGYFTATMMSFNTLGGIFRLIGYIFICFAAKKLSQYNRSFFVLLGWSLIMTLFSAATALSDISAFLSNNLLVEQPFISQGLTDLLTNTKIIFEFIFTAILSFCIRSIAKETGAEKIVYKAVRNFIYFCIFCVLQFLVWLAAQVDNPGLTEFIKSTALPAWMVILNLICIILFSLMIFSCYANICDIDDLEMKVKPSRFEFINRRRAKRESQSQAYIEEAQKYSEEQQARSAASARAKKKNKHK